VGLWILGNFAELKMRFEGPDVDEPITSLAMDGDAVWASHGSSLSKYIRGKKVRYELWYFQQMMLNASQGGWSNEPTGNDVNILDNIWLSNTRFNR